MDGVDEMELYDVYGTMVWLGEELLKDEQDAATRFARRCVKDVWRRSCCLAARRADKAGRGVMDTTSLYVEGAGGETLGRRGFWKDGGRDVDEMMLAVLLDGDGGGVCTEMWRGNTADVTRLMGGMDGVQRGLGMKGIWWWRTAG